MHYEACELTKHTHVHFPIRNNRNSQPFQLIHRDIWGPYIVPNISGVHWIALGLLGAICLNKNLS